MGIPNESEGVDSQRVVTRHYVSVVRVRDFPHTQTHLGVGKDGDSYYVYDLAFGQPSSEWHMHCGPYATFDDAAQWIRDIRE